MMKKNSVLLFSILISVLVLQGCDKNRVFEKNLTVEKSIWSSTEKLNFEVDVFDTSATYNVYINIRHAGIYPYSNLWLMVTTSFPDGTSKRQRVEVPLADEEGAWYGEGMGDIWDLKYLAQQNAQFNKIGKYHFSFEQIMRQNPLPGIMAMGLRVEQTTPIN